MISLRILIVSINSSTPYGGCGQVVILPMQSCTDCNLQHYDKIRISRSTTTSRFERHNPQGVSPWRGCGVFIFIGGSGRLMKLLHAEDGGMVMYVKRLEAGRFKIPEYDQESKSYPMEWRDLVVMVEGINEDPACRLRRLRAERTEYHV